MYAAAALIPPTAQIRLCTCQPWRSSLSAMLQCRLCCDLTTAILTSVPGRNARSISSKSQRDPSTKAMAASSGALTTSTPIALNASASLGRSCASQTGPRCGSGSVKRQSAARQAPRPIAASGNLSISVALPTRALTWWRSLPLSPDDAAHSVPHDAWTTIRAEEPLGRACCTRLRARTTAAT